MKNNYLKSALLSAALLSAAAVSADPHAAMLIAYPSVDAIESFQEKAAAEYFLEVNPDGVILTSDKIADIDASKLAYIWIHLDRCAIGINNLPAGMDTPELNAALAKFVADGGNLLLTKQATQYVHKIGRIDTRFAPGIFGDGDGGNGTDVWSINAQIGYMNREADPTQFYDHRSHAIYKDMESFGAFEAETFPTEGTGDGSEMWREDHNCMWDLNAYNGVYTSTAANTVRKFEEDNNAVVLGTWGHVVDYAVAGIVEFLPQSTKADATSGRIIANGLAACEWSPRSGVNAYHGNLRTLTKNCFDYLNREITMGVESAIDDAQAPVEYFTVDGLRVANPENGLFIRRQGSKVSKVILK